jgi:putative oxidoreductase
MMAAYPQGADMSEELLSTGVIAGRVLLGGAFAFAGARNIFNAPFLANMMAERGVPGATAALYLGIALQLAAGILFALGILVPYAAAALIVFLVVATWIFHNFWDHQGSDRAARVNGVISNVALIGSFLMALG